jgi:small subunit ribosomal protein S17
MADANATNPTPEARGNRRVVAGVVTRDTNAKTRRVEVDRLVRHPKYGKYVKQRTICYAHDEANESHLGDTVEIMESRPLSRTKRWRLVRVVAKAPTRNLANLEGAVPGSQVDGPQAAAKKE